MYGTVSRYRLKPGWEQAAIALSKDLGQNPPPGYVGGYTYRLDAGGDEYITASVWSDRETYVQNANDQQQQWFARVRELLVGDPQWNDAEVVFASRQE